MNKIVLPPDGSNVQLSQTRAAVLRWWLLAAVTVVVALAPTLLDIELPRLPMFAVLALMVAFNAYVHWRAATDERVDASELFVQLCVDLAGLALLLYLSGGAANPLISFLLVPVAVAALSLPGTLTAGVALIAVGLYSLLMWQFMPLSVAHPERAAGLHLAGMWLTFAMSAAMIAWFVVRMTASIRERDSQLAAAREQGLRDERVVALGVMAAGAAHELGTPLATIAVVVGELERESCLDAEVRGDLALVREQIALCKSIVSSMAARSGTLRPEQVEIVDARGWLEELRARWQAMRPQARGRLTLVGGSGAPLIVIEATLDQALINLLNNSADVSDAEVDITMAWDEAKLSIVIEDQGPGFPAEVLRQAGRVPLPARSGGAGVGLLLAFSAIERLGGRVALDNPPAGGARARVELPIVRKMAA